jgi:hypothetical protein
VINTEFIGVPNASGTASSLGCLSSHRITRSIDDAVLAQNAVGDVFQLCHNPNSRVLAPFHEICLAFHSLTFFLASSAAKAVNDCVARRRAGFEISSFAACEFAFREPLVNYWCTRVDMSPGGLVFSKMLSFQQMGSTAHEGSSFAFTRLRVARGLLFVGAAIQGELDKGSSYQVNVTQRNLGDHHVDAMLCSMYASTKQSQARRSHSLPVRLGVVTVMKNVIECYVPEHFRRPSERWIAPEQHGKIISFPTPQKKSAEHETAVQRRS